MPGREKATYITVRGGSPTLVRGIVPELTAAFPPESPKHWGGPVGPGGLRCPTPEGRRRRSRERELGLGQLGDERKEFSGYDLRL